MIVDKEKLKKKLIKQLNDNEKHYCSICKKLISITDIEDNNFEYVKNSLR